jgi:hypothetical protein
MQGKKKATEAALSYVSVSADGMTLTVSTSGTRPKPGAKITKWFLNWGDGNESSGNGTPPATLSHRYQNGGEYLLRLTVLDTNGAFAEAPLPASIRFRNVNAEPPPAPSASCTKTASAANMSSGANFQSWLNTAVAGDIMCMPAGTYTLGGGVSWTAPANVQLWGAGSRSTPGGGDATVIVDASVNDKLLEIILGSAGTFRLAGVTIRRQTAASGFPGLGPIRIFGNLLQELRIDHCHFDANGQSANGNGWLSEIYANGYMIGVVDNCIFRLTGGVAVRTQGYSWAGASFGDGAWAEAAQYGTNKFIFVETNQIVGEPSPVGGGVIDTYQGARICVRYNDSFNAATQTHPTGGSFRDRGTRVTEIYGNTVTSNTNGEFNWFYHSSGSALVWGNNVGNVFNNFITTHIIRRLQQSNYSQTPTPNGWGYCGTSFNGTGSNWDQNTSGSTGYACLDQPGRGFGALLANDFPNVQNTATGSIAWPSQYLEPTYTWGNTFSGPTFNAVFETEYNQNRDWFTDHGNSGCNPGAGSCTTGVGVGTLAQRPANCTANAVTNPNGKKPGVGWWATDTQTLYVCTATNVWEAYYQPYTYPHPLRSSLNQ